MLTPAVLLASPSVPLPKQKASPLFAVWNFGKHSALEVAPNGEVCAIFENDPSPLILVMLEHCVHVVRSLLSETLAVVLSKILAVVNPSAYVPGLQSSH